MTLQAPPAASSDAWMLDAAVLDESQDGTISIFLSPERAEASGPLDGPGVVPRQKRGLAPPESVSQREPREHIPACHRRGLCDAAMGDPS